VDRNNVFCGDYLIMQTEKLGGTLDRNGGLNRDYVITNSKKSLLINVRPFPPPQPAINLPLNVLIRTE
jgi:hypothetical protein